MTDSDRVATLVSRANPVPDVERLEPIPVGELGPLTNLQPRSSEMTQTETPPAGSEDRKSYAGWLVAAVLAIVVGVGVVILSQGGNETPPPATQPTPTTLAESQPTTTSPAPTTTVDRSAFQAATVDQVMAALYTDTVALESLPWRGSADRRVLFFHTYGVAVNGIVDSYTCTPGLDRVTCEVRSIDDISTAIDPDAAYDDLVTFIFDADDQIVNVSWTAESDQVLNDFHVWAGGASAEISNTAICDPHSQFGNGEQCALAHLGVLDDYLAGS